MERSKLIFLLLIFIAGIAVGMIITGIYDKHEYEAANSKLFEQLELCQEQEQIPTWVKRFNLTVNLT